MVLRLRKRRQVSNPIEDGNAFDKPDNQESTIENSTDFDLIVIGGGPAGYVGSIRGAQLGMKVACIEKRERLGGTCLNIGCIPSKALLDATEQFHQAKHSLDGFGIKTGEVTFELPGIMKHKDSVVKGLADGIDFLFRKNRVTRIRGTGSLLKQNSSHWSIQIDQAEGAQTISAKKVLLAMGSEVTELPFLPFDGKKIISSTEALSLEEVPGHLIVVGGGYIGLEMASAWSRLGSKITVIEAGERILPLSDETSAKELEKALFKQGFKFHFKTICIGAEIKGRTVIVSVKHGEEIATIEGDCVLVAVGRRPLSEAAGVKEMGLALDERKRIKVDGNYETSLSGVFAVGDLIAGPMLAHKASEEAVAAVERMVGVAGHVNYETIPSVIYTWPEYASVGAAEHELLQRGIKFKVGTFPFSANARARSLREVEGLARILADEKTDRILGVHIVGPRASEMIPLAVAVMEFGGSSEDVARTCFAHPTLPEVIKEAALDVDARRIHL